MDDTSSNEPIHADGFVDKIVDAQWYKKMNAQYKELCPDEPCLILPVIGYIDKTGTDVNQQNKMEPFTFTLVVLNCSFHYCLKAWYVLGFMPDLEQKSSAAITRGCAGLIGKGCMASSYHFCLSVILQSLKSNQGVTEAIHGFARIKNHVAMVPTMHTSCVGAGKILKSLPPMEVQVPQMISCRNQAHQWLQKWLIYIQHIVHCTNTNGWRAHPSIFIISYKS